MWKGIKEGVHVGRSPASVTGAISSDIVVETNGRVHHVHRVICLAVAQPQIGDKRM